MARLRFPGRPGYRFDRLGVRYGTDDHQKGLDPSSKLIDNVHRGLRYFRELFGESDEEDFEGFTEGEIYEAEKNLAAALGTKAPVPPAALIRKTRQQRSSDAQPSTSKDDSKAKRGTAKEISPRPTRGRVSLRDLQKKLFKRGIATPMKSSVGAKVRLMEQKRREKETLRQQKQTEKAEKSAPSPEETKKLKLKPIKIRLGSDGSGAKIVRGPGRPTIYDKEEVPGEGDEDEIREETQESEIETEPDSPMEGNKRRSQRGKLRGKIVAVPASKRKDKSIVKRLLNKAKRGGRQLRGAKKDDEQAAEISIKTESPEKKLEEKSPETDKPVATAASPIFMSPPKAAKVFILPAVSSRSSRKITPSRRFIEESSQEYYKKSRSPAVKLDTTPPAKQKGQKAVTPVSTEKESIIKRGQLSPALPSRGKSKSPNCSPQEAAGLKTPEKTDDNSEDTPTSPLLVGGKRDRRPSAKLIQKFTDDDESTLNRKLENRKKIEERKKSHTDESQPTASTSADEQSPESSEEMLTLEELERTAEATKRSGQNILRKAKLQLNRAALNRSKNALARSLKREMKKEEKEKEKLFSQQKSGEQQSVMAVGFGGFKTQSLFQQTSPLKLTSFGQQGLSTSQVPKFSSLEPLCNPTSPLLGAGLTGANASGRPPKDAFLFPKESTSTKTAASKGAQTDSKSKTSPSKIKSEKPAVGVSSSVPRQQREVCSVCTVVLDPLRRKGQQTKYYGVNCCAPCQWFYRRRLAEQFEKNKKFVCPKDGKCNIFLEKRMCIGCRFRRCQEVLPEPDKFLENEIMKLKEREVKKMKHKLGKTSDTESELDISATEVEIEKAVRAQMAESTGYSKTTPKPKSEEPRKSIELTEEEIEWRAEEQQRKAEGQQKINEERQKEKDKRRSEKSEKKKLRKMELKEKLERKRKEKEKRMEERVVYKQRKQFLLEGLSQIPELSIKKAKKIIRQLLEQNVEEPVEALLAKGKVMAAEIMAAKAKLQEKLKQQQQLKQQQKQQLKKEQKPSTSTKAPDNAAQGAPSTLSASEHSYHVTPQLSLPLGNNGDSSDDFDEELEAILNSSRDSGLDFMFQAPLPVDSAADPQPSTSTAIVETGGPNKGSMPPPGSSIDPAYSGSSDDYSDSYSDSDYSEQSYEHRGPRIKHVSRQVGVALGQTATFPSQPEIRLSALSQQAKQRFLKREEQKRPGTPDSDDLSIEEIIRRARDHDDGSIRLNCEPKKLKALAYRGQKATRRDDDSDDDKPAASRRQFRPTHHLTLSGKVRKRNVRCMKCAGCVRPDCRTCKCCIDMTKYGGKGTIKKACEKRVCTNPVGGHLSLKCMKRMTPTDAGGARGGARPKRRSGQRMQNILDDLGEDSDFDENEGTEVSPSKMAKLRAQRGGGVRGAHRVTREARNPLAKGAAYNALSRGVYVPPPNTGELQPARALKGLDKNRMVKKECGDIVILSSLVPASQRWIGGKDNYTLKGDIRNGYDIDSAWRQGISLISSGPMCIRTACFLCGSAGKEELVYCNVCCEPYHSFCLEERERPRVDNLENWCCRRCQFCHVCGKQNNLLCCDKCQNTYHPECLGPNYPAKPSRHKNIWVCMKCVKCRSCGATTPGTQPGACWTHDFTLCYNCGHLTDKGNYCPLCKKCYADDDWDCKMIQCSSCESWVHAKCEGLTDEMYQVLSYLPDEVAYNCRKCLPVHPAPWEQTIRREIHAGIAAVIGTMVVCKSTNHLQTLEEVLPKLPEVKSQPSSQRSTPSPAAHTEAELPLPMEELDPGVLAAAESLLQQVCEAEEAEKKQTSHNDPMTSTEPSDKSKLPVTTPNNENQLSEKIEKMDSEDNSQKGGAMDVDYVQCVEASVRQGLDVPTQNAKDATQSGDVPMRTDDVPAQAGIVPSQSGTDGVLSGVSNSMQNSVLTQNCDKTSNKGEELSNSKDKMADKTASPTQTVPCDNIRPRELVSKDDQCSMETSQIVCPEKKTGQIDTPQLKVEETETQTVVRDCQKASSLEACSDSPMEVGSVSQQNKNDEARPRSLTIPAVKNTDIEQIQKSNLVKSDQPRASGTQRRTVRFEDDMELVDILGSDGTQSMDDRSPSATLTADEVAHDTLSDFGDFEVNKVPDYISLSAFMPVKPEKKLSLFPKDLKEVKNKVVEKCYRTVEEFNDDIVRIIQFNLNEICTSTTPQYRRKAMKTVQTLFVKTMQECFPWFSVANSRLWANNRRLPDGMLESATVPPNDDHTYAQWMEKEQGLMSPQPSPFKRVNPSPHRKIRIPMASFDEDGESGRATPTSIIHDEGDDTRKCLLCGRIGDDDTDQAGRLVYANQDDWVHINCALWSAEVYEESDHSLQKVQTALSRGTKLKCDHCGLAGATVGCCCRGCSANFHFMCARKQRCIFQEDKKVFCRKHWDQMDGELVDNNRFGIVRRSCVDTNDMRWTKKGWVKGIDPRTVNVLCGSMTVESLGRLSPLSDTRIALVPIDFCSTRVFWSTVDARRRSIYTCRVIVVHPAETTIRETIVKDMTVIHDENHPDYDLTKVLEFEEMIKQQLAAKHKKRKRRRSIISGAESSDNDSGSDYSEDEKAKRMPAWKRVGKPVGRPLVSNRPRGIKGLTDGILEHEGYMRATMASLFGGKKAAPPPKPPPPPPPSVMTPIPKGSGMNESLPKTLIGNDTASIEKPKALVDKTPKLVTNTKVLTALTTGSTEPKPVLCLGGVAKKPKTTLSDEMLERLGQEMGVTDNEEEDMETNSNAESFFMKTVKPQDATTRRRHSYDSTASESEGGPTTTTKQVSLQQMKELFSEKQATTLGEKIDVIVGCLGTSGQQEAPVLQTQLQQLQSHISSNKTDEVTSEHVENLLSRVPNLLSSSDLQSSSRTSSLGSISNEIGSILEKVNDNSPTGENAAEQSTLAANANSVNNDVTMANAESNEDLVDSTLLDSNIESQQESMAAKEQTMKGQLDGKHDSDSEEEASSQSPNSKLKAYPLRRTAARVAEPSLQEQQKMAAFGNNKRRGSNAEQQQSRNEELPLADKIALRIKTESLARSAPGDDGPFKCPNCKRIYRTQESYHRHVDDCDYYVSSEEEEEDEEGLSTRRGDNEWSPEKDKSPTKNDASLPTRMCLRDNPVRRSIRGQNQGHNAAAENTPVVGNSCDSESDVDTEKKTKGRGRGRPPSNRPPSPEAIPSHLTRSMRLMRRSEGSADSVSERRNSDATSERRNSDATLERRNSEANSEMEEQPVKGGPEAIPTHLTRSMRLMRRSEGAADSVTGNSDATSEQRNSDANSETEEQPVKRGRGRPRKNPHPEEQQTPTVGRERLDSDSRIDLASNNDRFDNSHAPTNDSMIANQVLQQSVEMVETPRTTRTGEKSQVVLIQPPNNRQVINSSPVVNAKSEAPTMSTDGIEIVGTVNNSHPNPGPSSTHTVTKKDGGRTEITINFGSTSQGGETLKWTSDQKGQQSGTVQAALSRVLSPTSQLTVIPSQPNLKLTTLPSNPKAIVVNPRKMSQQIIRVTTPSAVSTTPMTINSQNPNVVVVSSTSSQVPVQTPNVVKIVSTVPSQNQNVIKVVQANSGGVTTSRPSQFRVMSPPPVASTPPPASSSNTIKTVTTSGAKTSPHGGQIELICPSGQRILLPSSAKLVTVKKDAPKQAQVQHKPTNVIDLNELLNSQQQISERMEFEEDYEDEEDYRWKLSSPAKSDPSVKPVVQPLMSHALKEALSKKAQLVAKNSPQVLTVPNSSPQVSTVPNSSPQVLTVQKSSPQALTVQKNIPQALTVQNSSPQVLTVQNNSPQVMTVQNSSPQVLTVQNSSPQVLTVQNSSPQVLTVQNTSSQVSKVPNTSSQVLTASQLLQQMVTVTTSRPTQQPQLTTSVKQLVQPTLSTHRVDTITRPNMSTTISTISPRTTPISNSTASNDVKSQVLFKVLSNKNATADGHMSRVTIATKAPAPGLTSKTARPNILTSRGPVRMVTTSPAPNQTVKTLLSQKVQNERSPVSSPRPTMVQPHMVRPSMAPRTMTPSPIITSNVVKPPTSQQQLTLRPAATQANLYQQNLTVMPSAAQTTLNATNCQNVLLSNNQMGQIYTVVSGDGIMSRQIQAAPMSIMSTPTIINQGVGLVNSTTQLLNSPTTQLLNQSALVQAGLIPNTAYIQQQPVQLQTMNVLQTRPTLLTAPSGICLQPQVSIVSTTPTIVHSQIHQQQALQQQVQQQQLLQHQKIQQQQIQQLKQQHIQIQRQATKVVTQASDFNNVVEQEILDIAPDGVRSISRQAQNEHQPMAQDHMVTLSQGMLQQGLKMVPQKFQVSSQNLQHQQGQQHQHQFQQQQKSPIAFRTSTIMLPTSSPPKLAAGQSTVRSVNIVKPKTTTTHLLASMNVPLSTISESQSFISSMLKGSVSANFQPPTISIPSIAGTKSKSDQIILEELTGRKMNVMGDARDSAATSILSMLVNEKLSQSPTKNNQMRSILSAKMDTAGTVTSGSLISPVSSAQQAFSAMTSPGNGQQVGTPNIVVERAADGKSNVIKYETTTEEEIFKDSPTDLNKKIRYKKIIRKKIIIRKAGGLIKRKMSDSPSGAPMAKKQCVVMDKNGVIQRISNNHPAGFPARQMLQAPTIVPRQIQKPHSKIMKVAHQHPINLSSLQSNYKDKNKFSKFKLPPRKFNKVNPKWKVNPKLLKVGHMKENQQQDQEALAEENSDLLRRKVRKQALRARNDMDDHHSRPVIHPHLQHPMLPQPEMEEEVVSMPVENIDDDEPHRLKQKKDGPHLVYEITSEDGFHVRADSSREAWKAVTDRVQDARANARLKQLSYSGINGLAMFGLVQNSVTFLVEQLYGAQHCTNYKFRYQDYRNLEGDKVEENPSGAARCEPFHTRKHRDMFSFLLSKYRPLPHREALQKDDDLLQKSQRRATSMALPMAMRFRHLRLHSKEAIGVYRSPIHGRGLFCKRDIDLGEMIVEYAGEVIRSIITDSREKYYESKGIGCYMFRIDEYEVIDATTKGNAARFINHCCDPNCYSRVITIENKKHIVIFALRSIKKGEELTYDYKFPIEEVKILCTCNAKRCRKYLN